MTRVSTYLRTAVTRQAGHKDSKYYTQFIPGKMYRMRDFEDAEWIDKTGRLIDQPAGYDVHDYLDNQGRYKGPDKDGIEPVKPR